MDALANIRSTRGALAKIAAELRITRAAVSTWKRVPAERVAEVERITGIPRHELRPDLWEAPRGGSAA